MNNLCNLNNIHNVIYRKLQRLIPDLLTLEQGDYRKSNGDGTTRDLILKVLSNNSDCLLISLAHYCLDEKGELSSDPAVKILINHQEKTAKPLVYQMFEDKQFAEKGEEHLDNMLRHWLNSCINQGHSLKQVNP